ncbi:MerR family transcriptional regulator [Irregularibacter muris]|uniref:MerR family transcriptional regulator n=1 Tax=Irregularibacter muris TaxID=1796619 RepID=A0AAE3HJ49_9FIRM|nr:MerR family transcriptional regulator [Irregularibacter muris]MCR1899809.1 MerR family transcriptional regulator [Irregularibacter muris]
MSKYIKIGDLASMTGITVRTLHYYDEIGLLKPAQITEKGHRLYNMQSITEIYRIMAMKDMGFNLDEIKDLMKSKDINVLNLVEIQISNVQEEIAQKQLLFSKLLTLKQKLKDSHNLSLEDFQAMLPFINSSADKYFTKEQFDKLKDCLEDYNSGKDTSSEWFNFISKLTYCYKNKLSKSDKRTKECVDYWNDFTNNLIGKDEQIKNSVFAFHASQSNRQLRYGLTDELYMYLMGLMEE